MEVVRSFTELPMVMTLWSLTLMTSSVLLYGLDVVTDGLLVARYIYDGDANMAYATLALIAVPYVITSLSSLRFYVLDGRMSIGITLAHVFGFAIFFRYWELLKDFTDASTDRERFRVKQQYCDVTLLRLFEAFLESAPQLTLQLYIMARTESWPLLTGVSVGVSLLSVGWSVAGYIRSQRAIRMDKVEMSHSSLAVYTCWRTFAVTARIIALVALALVVDYWVVAIFFIHWIVMCMWIRWQKTDFCSVAFEEFFYNLVIGWIYCFCFFNLKESTARFRMLGFYVVMTLENIAFASAYWHLYEQHSIFFRNIVFAIFSCCTLAGYGLMLLYYRFFHPSGPIVWFPERRSMSAEDDSKMPGAADVIKPDTCHKRETPLRARTLRDPVRPASVKREASVVLESYSKRPRAEFLFGIDNPLYEWAAKYKCRRDAIPAISSGVNEERKEFRSHKSTGDLPDGRMAAHVPDEPLPTDTNYFPRVPAAKKCLSFPGGIDLNRSESPEWLESVEVTPTKPDSRNSSTSTVDISSFFDAFIDALPQTVSRFVMDSLSPSKDSSFGSQNEERSQRLLEESQSSDSGIDIITFPLRESASLLRGEFEKVEAEAQSFQEDGNPERNDKDPDMGGGGVAKDLCHVEKASSASVCFADAFDEGENSSKCNFYVENEIYFKGEAKEGQKNVRRQFSLLRDTFQTDTGVLITNFCSKNSELVELENQRSVSGLLEKLESLEGDDKDQSKCNFLKSSGQRKLLSNCLARTSTPKSADDEVVGLEKSCGVSDMLGEGVGKVKSSGEGLDKVKNDSNETLEVFNENLDRSCGVSVVVESEAKACNEGLRKPRVLEPFNQGPIRSSIEKADDSFQRQRILGKISPVKSLNHQEPKRRFKERKSVPSKNKENVRPRRKFSLLREVFENPNSSPL